MHPALRCRKALSDRVPLNREQRLSLHLPLVQALQAATSVSKNAANSMVFSKTVSSSFLEDSTMVDASRKKCEMT